MKNELKSSFATHWLRMLLSHWSLTAVRVGAI